MKEEAIIVSKKGKKSIGFKIAITILIILLLPVVLAGLLLLYVSIADFKYDDPDKVLSDNVPMSFSQHFEFSEKDMTAVIRLNNYDLYYLIKDEIPELKLNDSVYVNAYRIALEDKAIYVQGKAFGINIPVKLGIEAGCEDDKVSIQVKKAYLGKLCIPIPINSVAKKQNIDLKYTVRAIDFPNMGPLKAMEVKDGLLMGTFRMDNSFMKEGLNSWQYLKSAWFYSAEKDLMVMLLKDYNDNWDKEDHVSDELREYMRSFEKEPEEFQKLLIRMLASGPKRVADKYFSSEAYNQRSMSLLYPGITPEAVEKIRLELSYEQNYLFLKDFALNIDDKFGKYQIAVKGNNFVDSKSKKIASWSSLLGDAPEAKEVFPDGTELCAIFCEGADGYQRINGGKFSCGTAVRFVNGNCAVICKMKDNLYITEISNEEYEGLASGRVKGYVAAIKDK